jgi:hypothetical protein
MLAIPFYLAGAAMAWLALRPLRWMPSLALRGKDGIVHPASSPARSPLDGTDVVYCRWTIKRRLLSRGVDDEITGEVTAKFTVNEGGDAIGIKLEHTTLTLRPGDERGWTVSWDGLVPAARAIVRSAFPEVVPDAMYHLSQVVLTPGTRVWLTPDAGVLADRSPTELARATSWLVGLRLVVSGLLFWVGHTVGA